MLVLQKQKHVYVEVIKTGTHSVCEWLTSNYGGRRVRPGDRYHHSCDVPRRFGGYTVFVTVRNPYEKIFSHFAYSKARRSFKEFMAYLIEHKDGNFNPGVKFPYIHCTQKKQYDLSGATIFIRLESFREDARNKLSFVLRPVPSLPKLNATRGKPAQRFHDYFGKEEEQMVWEYCREDFEAFGYERIN